jgi:cytochrome c oxidase cbb3-type subunit 3
MSSRSREPRRASGVAGALVVLALAGCGREERELNVAPPPPSPAGQAVLSGVRPGGTPPPASPNPFENDAYALSQGQTLYAAYNCQGCHAHGGGDGPPLMDDRWIYGGAPENVFASIVEGRPNGMPSFRGKIPDAQVWQLVAYVRALGGHVRKDAAPQRTDHLSAVAPPQSRPTEGVHDVGSPALRQGTR